MDNTKFAFSLIALVIGGAIPTIIIDIEINDELLWRSMAVISTAMLFFTVYLFNYIGTKKQKLREWCINTAVGLYGMLFLGSFIIMLFSNLYMIVPLAPWLHLSISVLIGLVSVVFILQLFSHEGK